MSTEPELPGHYIGRFRAARSQRGLVSAGNATPLFKVAILDPVRVTEVFSNDQSSYFASAASRQSAAANGQVHLRLARAHVLKIGLMQSLVFSRRMLRMPAGPAPELELLARHLRAMSSTRLLGAHVRVLDAARSLRHTPVPQTRSDFLPTHVRHQNANIAFGYGPITRKTAWNASRST